MGATVLQFPVQFVAAGACVTCGVEIVLPKGFYETALKKKDLMNFYCCNGHSQHFTGETEADKLRRQLAQKDAELAAKANQLKLADRQVAAARGAVTKIKNRVGNGVCPCCNRTFQNLMRHMKTKHPGYKDEK